jgi:hypothetical protein
MYGVMFVVMVAGVFWVKRLEHQFNQELNDAYLKLHDIVFLFGM